MPRKLTKKEFIDKAKEVHGNDKYGYDKVKYINNRTKVEISCIEHGVFKQIPSDHLSGKGCPKCGGTQKSNTEDFIDKAKEVHGNDKYGYDKVEYINAQTKVEISCIEHGVFKQIPNAHLSGKGCPKCAGTQKSNTEDFIDKAKEVHGNDKYGYDKVKYENYKTNVEITCPKHGNFEQTPNAHLSGHGCPKCAGNQKSNTEDFIDKAKEVHGNDKYSYDKVEYINVQTNVKITCLEDGHGNFEQTPNNHLSGHGCPKCAKGNYSKTSIEFLKTFPYPIIHAENEGEKYIETKKTKYKADGYFKASTSEEIDDIFSHCHQDLFRFRNPNSLEVVIEFHGCFWHGCENCYTERDAVNSKNSKTYGDLYKATNRKKISIIKSGYNYIEIWECQYHCLVKGNFKTDLNT